MLLENDISPNKTLYYLGSEVMGVLQSSTDNSFDFFDVYQKVNEKEQLSMSLFVLVLDWLYILGLVRQNVKGDLEKCF